MISSIKLKLVKKIIWNCNEIIQEQQWDYKEPPLSKTQIWKWNWWDYNKKNITKINTFFMGLQHILNTQPKHWGGIITKYIKKHKKKNFFKIFTSKTNKFISTHEHTQHASSQCISNIINISYQYHSQHKHHLISMTLLTTTTSFHINILGILTTTTTYIVLFYFVPTLVHILYSICLWALSHSSAKLIWLYKMQGFAEVWQAKIKINLI